MKWIGIEYIISESKYQSLPAEVRGRKREGGGRTWEHHREGDSLSPSLSIDGWIEKVHSLSTL